MTTLDTSQSQRNILHHYLSKYCEIEKICLKKYLLNHWEKNTYFDTCENKDLTDIKVRDRLIPYGRILEEDLNHHIYVMLISVGRLGKNDSFVVIQMNPGTIEIAAFFKEGIIKQDIAEKAVTVVRNALQIRSLKQKIEKKK